MSETEKLMPARINMKSYLFKLLLLLLLVDKTLSRPYINPSLGKAIYKEITGQALDYAWEKAVEKIKDHFSPSQQGKQIPGLSEIKQYFYDFGYLQDSGPFDDSLDKDTISSIKTYQQYFNLQVTGDLNNETFQQISLPRCGIPDMNFDSGFTTDVNVSWPKGNQWFPKGTKNLTYGFLPASEIPLNATKVFRDAFTRWSQSTRLLNFTEETTYDDANIKIGFYAFGEGVEDVVVGGTIVTLKTDSNVKNGEIRLDGTKYWVLPTDNYTWSWQQGEFDLESVVMHQIGHLLGLDHSSNEESVMYPTILPSQQKKVQITDSDNHTIHQLYTTNANSGNAGPLAVLFGSGSGLLTILSLGFAFMALPH